MGVSALKPIAFVVVLAGLIGCGKTPTAPSHFAQFSQTDLQVGTGATAAANNRLTVNYTLWLYNASAIDNKGLQLESTVGQTPFTFILAQGSVIDGWVQGVFGMREGGRRRLVVPPSQGYGQNRNGSIPPSATLLFEIELLTVEVQ
jgi:FKBP-type peptidyl-prolyl cis-trans isomerase FkpA